MGDGIVKVPGTSNHSDDVSIWKVIPRGRGGADAGWTEKLSICSSKLSTNPMAAMAAVTDPLSNVPVTNTVFRC